MVYFDQIMLTCTFEHCLATGQQNGDEASLKNLTIVPASPTINPGTAITYTDCSSIYPPTLSTVSVYLNSIARPTPNTYA